MTEPIANQTKPASRRWVRWIVGVGVLLLVALASLYFIATSGAFFKGVILPRISAATGSQITVETASIHPFSEVILRRLTVQAGGGDPIVSAEEIRARYDLMAILKGHLLIDEITLESPIVQIVENADGSRNTDVFTKKPTSKPAPGSPAPASAPPQLDLRKLALNGAKFRLIQRHKDGTQDVTEVTNVNLSLVGLKNGQTAKLTLGAGIFRSQSAAAPATNGTVGATLAAGFELGLADDLQPLSIKGSTRLQVNTASGGLAQLADMILTLASDATPTEIRSTSLQLQRGQTSLAQVRVSGPFDLAKTEGVLRIEIGNIDRAVLNPAGASAGIDFLSTLINSTNEIAYTNRTRVVAATGSLDVSRFSVERAGVTTLPLDLQLGYSITADLAGSTAVVRTFHFTGRQGDRPLLEINAAQPLTLGWGANAQPVGDSTVNFSVTNFKIAEWKALIGTNLTAGVFNLAGTLRARQAGKWMNLQMNSRLDGLEAAFGAAAIRRLGVGVTLDTTITNFNAITAAGLVNLDQLSIQQSNAVTVPLDLRVGYALSADLAQSTAVVGTLEVNGRQGDRPLLNLNVTRPMTVAWGSNAAPVGDAFVSFALTNFNLADWKPFLGTNISAGVLNVAGTIEARQAGKSLNLQMASRLDGLNGAFGTTSLTGTALRVQMDSKITNFNQVDITSGRIGWKLSADDLANNEMQLLGQVDTSTPGALRGGLKITSGALDLTSYYDRFAGGSKPADKPAPAGTAGPTTNAPPAREPEALTLPVEKFTLDIQIGRIRLREVEITNLLSRALITSNRVVLNPCQFGLNGGPVRASADINVGVPGFLYDLTLGIDKVPLEPLANSFVEAAARGKYKGDILAQAHIVGAGVTPPNLRKALNAQFGFSFTNADIQIVGPRLKSFLTPIGLALRVPDLAQTPLNWVGTESKIANGKINLGQFSLFSPAFSAQTKGELTLAENPMKSSIPNWPMTFQLRRPLAAKSGLMPKDTPTNATYVTLPEFLRIKGTLDQPAPDISLKALANTALEKYVDKIPGVDQRTGGLIKGVGNFLTGQKPADTNAPAGADTNGPAAKPASPLNPFDLFKRPKK